MLDKINHVKYTKTCTERQLVLPLDYGISLEQDRLVYILDALLERLDYSALQHLYSAKGRNPKVRRVADHIVADAGYDSEENMDWIQDKGRYHHYGKR